MADRYISKAATGIGETADKLIQCLIEKWPEIEARALDMVTN